MAEVRYVFGDALTGAVIEEIALQGVSVSEGIDGGDLQGSFGLNQTGKNNSDLIGATIPGKCFVVMERNDQPIWGGLIWSRVYQSQAESVQLYAKTFDQYLTKRVIDYDISITATDPRNIMRTLYNTMQLDPYSIRVDVPAAVATLTTMDLEVFGTELKTYRTVADQIAANNFEWRVAWARVGGVYVKTLTMGQPTIGQTYGPNSTTFEYPGNILNFWQNTTIAQSGTDIYGVGSGEGASMPIIRVTHADLQTNNWPRLDAQITRKGIDDVSLLTQVTQEQAAVLKAPSNIYTVEMKADREPEFSDWGLGDGCNLVLQSGLGTIVQPARIINWVYTPPQSDTVEEVRLMFEGDELA